MGSMMRGLLIALLLVAGFAHGEDRQAQVCGDSTRHQAGYCPAVLSSPGFTAVGETGASCTSVSDVADGTQYCCMTSTATPLSASAVANCTGGAAVAGANQAVSGSGVQTVAATGLTASTGYYAQSANLSPEQWYSNAVVSSQFTTDSEGGYPYDLTLGGTRTIPFTYTWPTAPNLTPGDEVVVTPATISANIVAGRKITLSAGTYGNINFSANDMEIVIRSGVTIGDGAQFAVAVNATGSRIIIRGDTPRAGSIVGQIETTGADVLLDGLNQNATEVLDGRNQLNGVRNALINSYLRIRDFATSSFSGSGTDIIVANNQLESSGSTQAGNRLQNVNRLIFVDNRVVKTGSGHHIFRLHTPDTGQDTDNNFVSGNQFEGHNWQIRPIPGGLNSGDPHGRMIHIWVTDNTIYDSNIYGTNSFEMGTTSNNDFAEIFVMTGNAVFGSNIYPTEGMHPWDATINNNTTSGFISPPAWDFR